MPSQPLTRRSINHLVRSGDDDELFLVERFDPYPQPELIRFQRFACRVSMLDEEAGKWVEVSDLGDRVFFIGHYDNVACSAKELPSGCGLSGNSIVFTSMGPIANAYKYGVETGHEEDEPNWWRVSNENSVNCLWTSPVVAEGVNRGMQLSTSPVMAKQHFFKPLLPGFHSHLTIPEAFFLKYMKGRTEQSMAKLRSDASKITWEVKVEEDGQKLTDGWKEFALSHDLRVGDIVVFRQERDMAFHVTPFGPSCCEIQYESCLDNENNLGKKNPRREKESCFVANVTPSTLQSDRLNLPRSFVRANGLDKKRGEIVLMNEKGQSWTSDLKGKRSCRVTYIKHGWRSFCHANGLKPGGFYTFKLIIREGSTVLRLLSEESEEEEYSEGDEIESLSTESESDEERNPEMIQMKKKVKKNPRREAESTSLEPSCFVANVSPATLRYDSLNLPRPFVRTNGLDTSIGEIVLMNEKESEEEEESSESESNEEGYQEEKGLKKRRSIWKASSSPSENRFVTLTLTPYNVKKSILFLPIPFSRINGISVETKMALLDKHGVNWPTNLRSERTRIKLVGGWKDFVKANCVKTSESVKLELIWKEDTSCVLKFCSIVKPMTK
ncbi:hypothetical protein AALP_AA6G271700 [Arabis alpina]|uniref:TF-B3 domain-containing protein n=1 Tax=Arabis alpina TaxID=50452 RepID=A0A087GS06_ARAAL|nr:hypothetical protein AALP_AA6G271700 [Arabis alpina]